MTMILQVSDRNLSAIRRALFKRKDEHLVFGFARWRPHGVHPSLEVTELRAILSEEYEYQSPYHLRLTNEAQATLIKEAHDREAALVEWHSHRFPSVAAFSMSDMSGFEEFVPHVLWRLPGRPYAAVVLERTTFDALLWVARGEAPRQIAGIETESQTYLSTARTLQGVGSEEDGL